MGKCLNQNKTLNFIADKSQGKLNNGQADVTTQTSSDAFPTNEKCNLTRDIWATNK